MEHSLEKEDISYYNPDLFAKAGVLTLFNLLSSDEESGKKNVFEAKKALIETEPHNIVLKNALDFFLFRLEGNKESVSDRYNSTIKKIDTINKEAAEICIKKIKEGSTVFVHSLNNQLFYALEKAAAQKKFTLTFVEHRPFLFGNHLEKKLKNKIKTKQYLDIAIGQAILSSDICLIGADALLKGGSAIGKTGSAVAIDMAEKANIPVYLFIHSLKLDNGQAHKNQINLSKHAEERDINEKLYELIQKEKIDGFVCEHGIYSPTQIISEIKFYNEWLFL